MQRTLSGVRLSVMQAIALSMYLLRKWNTVTNTIGRSATGVHLATLLRLRWQIVKNLRAGFAEPVYLGSGKVYALVGRQ